MLTVLIAYYLINWCRVTNLVGWWLLQSSVGILTIYWRKSWGSRGKNWCSIYMTHLFDSYQTTLFDISSSCLVCGNSDKIYDDKDGHELILVWIFCAGVLGTAIRHSTSCAGHRGPLAAAPAGTTSAVPDCSTNHDSADRISGQFLFYHDHNFTKVKGNLRFWRLVPLFVPIGVCVMTHDDGTASDITIGMWHHNQQATNHERNGKPWFALPK